MPVTPHCPDRAAIVVNHSFDSVDMYNCIFIGPVTRNHYFFQGTLHPNLSFYMFIAEPMEPWEIGQLMGGN